MRRRIVRIKKCLGLITIAAALALILTGCGPSGISFLALDYSAGTVTALDFPVLPAFVTWGEYYQHSEGTYSGAYTNGVLRSFNYTIEVNPGLLFGKQGEDRYYTMWLEPTGPELYYFDASASLAGKVLKASEKSQINNAPIDTSLYDLDHPEPFSYERSFNGVTFRVTGNKYQLK